MDILNSKKLIRSKAGLKMVSTNADFKSPFVIQEPHWVLDNEVLNCTHCNGKFTFTNRKHHCRRCGKIFCNYCCKTKIELHRMCFVDPVRICLKCEPQTRLENVFFDTHLKQLMNGAVFKFESNGSGKKGFQLLQCKLSQDHRYLLFEGVLNILPIEINSIKSLQVTTNASTGAKSLFIDYAVGELTKSIRLDLASGPQVERTGKNWLTAIEKAYNMLNSREEIRVSS